MDTGLADRIRAKGVEVVEVAGWKTRGYRGLSFKAVLALMHHTAGGTSGSVPSLATCIYGRPDVPGPLIPVLQSREPDGWDKAYVIAAGKCNHAGTGTWRGVSGNGLAGGVEVEHTGTGPVASRRREVTCRILAALLEGPGASRDARNACQHFEYATPRGRKIDFRDLAPDTPASIRERVAYWIGRTVDDTEDDDMTIDDLKDVLDGYAHRIAGVPDFRAWMTAVYENSRTAASEGAVDVDVDGSVDNVFKLYAAKGEQGEDTPLHRIIRQVLAES